MNKLHSVQRDFPWLTVYRSFIGSPVSIYAGTVCRDQHVPNLNSTLDYPLDEKKKIDIENKEVFSLPLKLGPLAI